MVKQDPLKEKPHAFTALAPLEIERKWVVECLPELSGVAARRIRQGYLTNASEGSEVRVRECEDEFYLTTKSQGGLVRSEIQKEISAEEFASHWDKTLGKRVEKLRYRIPYGAHIIDFDVYQGPRKGLMIAEVEFSSLREAELFVPPPWFGREVTEDAAFKNCNLAA
jgi:adenylate cyclase